MKKTLFLLFIVFLLLAPQPTRAETFNFTSYYPAPSGRYINITLQPKSAITPATSCPIGTIYSNSSDNSIPYFCELPLSGIPKYSPLMGPWTNDNNDIYLTDRSTPQNKRVAIGTKTPISKLTILGDGGILSDDLTTASYTPLTLTGGGTRLIWYPKKGAFRAGYVTDAEWNDANIGNNSVAMGYGNQASGDGTIIWGGKNNRINIPVGVPLSSPPSSVICGGEGNISSGSLDQILGGQNNTANDATVVSGQNNNGSKYAMIGGGSDNNSPFGSAIGEKSTILGGRNNSARANFSTISGGRFNTINQSCTHCTIAGGLSNTIDPNGSSSTISGGDLNFINNNSSVIGGGKNNAIGFSLTNGHSTISGGESNTIHDNSLYATISGGKSNEATCSTGGCSVAGGYANHAANDYTTVMGGASNTASGDHSIVVGGANNKAGGSYSIVAGRNMELSAAANNSFLWGYSAAAITPINMPNAFIIYSGRMGIRDTNPAALLEINGNNSTDDFLKITSNTTATAGNVLTIKASNGYVGVGVTNPQYPLDFGGGVNVDVNGNFNPPSSRKLKDNIMDLSLTQARETFHKLEPVRFNYKNEKDEEYLGFIAEDVPELVATNSRKGIVPMDIVAVLTEVIQDQQTTLEQQKKETDDLLQEVNELREKIKHEK